VALMTKHLLAGKDISLFFYGQAYGFSFIECLFILPFYALFGVSTLSVKIGMLLLWTIGVIFLYKAFAALSRNPNTSLVLIITFIALPAWAVWSMKARGGYLTAFTATSIILYLLFKKEGKKTSLTYYIIGVLTVLVYQSQPLWLPGLIPLLLFKGFEKKRRLLDMAIPIAILSLAFLHLKQSLPQFYIPKDFISLQESIKNIPRIPAFLYASQHGKYFFDQLQHPDNITALCAILVCAITVILLFIALARFIKSGKITLFTIAALSIVLTLSYTIISEKLEPRYLLPIAGFTCITLQTFLAERPSAARIFYPVAAITILCGSYSLYTFKDFMFCKTTEKPFRQTLQYLEDNNVHYTYCNDNLLTWQIIFYSNEQVLCHERFLPGRYPAYTHKVDSAYYAGAKTALIGFEQEYYGLDIHPSLTMKGFFIVYNPPKTLLQKNFRLW
ncbi:MAG: hypothetical protein JSS96_17030, partial [Bacteroidetes bacterium]|nr:hypothetical protein [Bacteroidota bacterium]